MNIPFLFMSFLILSGGSSVAATDNSELEVGELCGSFTYQVLKPIADELQKEQLKNNCDSKDKEIKDLREKVQQLEQKIAEGKLKDDLILSKDTHIKDLQNIIAELEKTNKQLVVKVSQEIGQLKSFIKEELKFSQNNKLTENSQIYTEGSMRETLKSCQLNLNKTHNEVSEYKAQLDIKNSINAENTEMISQLSEKVKELDEHQVTCNKQKDIIKDQKEEISKLKEHTKKDEVKSTSCNDYGHSNSVQNIVIPNFKPFRALCNSDVAGPGWTVIQQRLNGRESFNRNWETYKNGFGEFAGDFFLGLEKIYRLTDNRSHELYIHMEQFGGNTFYARYDNFRIAGEEDKYRLLSLGAFTGTAGIDRMRASEHQMFSTWDSDNDSNRYSNCAVYYSAGWWYGSRPCSNCNLNAVYNTMSHVKGSISWTPDTSLTTIKMLIRPREN